MYVLAIIDIDIGNNSNRYYLLKEEGEIYIRSDLLLHSRSFKNLY